MSQTLNSLYQSLRQQLLTITASEAQAGTEAALILDHVLHIPQEAIYSKGNEAVDDQQTNLIQHFLEQRIQKRIPIQYLLHQACFYGLDFYVNPSVLIPRPETELLVEQALARIKEGMRVLDVGTGPGSIAIALSHKLDGNAHVVATDISPNALKVARINQKNLGTTVEFKEPGDLFEPIKNESFDVIVSNPPYIDPVLKETLNPEVLWHEPQQALFPPGEDAYYFYRRLIREGKAHLKPGGSLMVETGAGMTPDVSQLFMTEGYKNIRIIRDYADLDRIVIAELD